MTSKLLFRTWARRYLKMFAGIPVSSQVLYCSPYYFDEGLDLSMFRGLRSLGIPILRIMNKGITTHASKALSTVCPGFQHLSQAININKDLHLQFTTLPFASSLISLTLEGEHGQCDVEHLLQLFP